MNSSQGAFFIFLFFLFVSDISAQNWNINEIGPCPVDNVWGITIANAQNDGVNRIYVSAKNGGIYEWTFESGEWIMQALPFQTEAKLISITSGVIHNDRLERLYFAEWQDEGKVIEASYLADLKSWDIVEIGINAKANTGILVGDARNDGKRRVYVAGFFGVNEYEFIDGVWTETPVYAGTAEGIGQIASVKNADSTYFYSNGNFVYENRWNGESWENHTLYEEAKWPESIAIGQARNDGVNRIYAKTSLGRIELSYVNGAWEKVVLSELNQRGALITGITQKDGLERVYTNLTKAWKIPDSGPLYQYTWNGKTYDEEMILDGVSGATGMIEIGDGRNDGTNRIYVPHFDTGGIFEITHVDSFRVIPDRILSIEKPSFNIYPNPTNRELNIDMLLEGTNENRTVNIFSAAGKLLQQYQYKSDLSSFQIDVSELEFGFYILQIGNQNQKFEVVR